MRVLSVILVAFFAFFEVVKCGHGSPWSKRHNSNVDVAAAQQNIALGKRVNGARFTFYAAGLGACGKVNSASDFIVAINAAQYAGGAHCGQVITITVNGKSAQALIMDMCMGCGYNNLDLTRGLFDYLGLEAEGALIGSWVFGVAASPSTKSTLTSTTTYQPPPSSTSSVTQYTTSNSTSTQAPTPTSTQSSASISSPTPLIPSQEAGNIANLFLTFIQVESLLAIAHGS